MLTVKQKNIIGFLFLALCLAYAISPLFKEITNGRHIDARPFYVHGVCWLSGKSPYNLDVYRDVWKEKMENETFRPELPETKGATVYPPSLAIYTMPSAFFGWDTAKYYYDFMNVIFLLAIIFFLTRLIKNLPSMRADMGQIGIVLGLGCFISAVPATIFIGQLSLLALTGCLGAFYFSERKQFFIAGLFVVLASIKPHITLPFIIYLFITQRDWRFLGWSSLLVGTTFMGVLIMGGDLNPVPEIVTNLQSYNREGGPNSPVHLPGLTYLTANLGISRAIFIFLGLTIVTVLALWFRKMSIAPNQETSEIWASHQKEQSILAMALIFSITALFMPLHGYDYTIFFPVVILLVVVRWNLAWWLIPGILLVARPGNLENVLSRITETPVPGVLLASLGVIYLTLTIAIIIWKLRSEALEAIGH